jgi:signal transduction histidine kinase
LWFAVALASNGLLYFLSRLQKTPTYYRVLANVIILLDIALITYFIFNKGGIESRSPILYTLPILMSAAVLGRAAIYRTSILSAITYSALVVADYYNVIQTIEPANSRLRDDFPYVSYTVIFYSAVLIMIGFITDFITRLLLDKERQALENAEALRRAQALAKLGSWEWDIKTDKLLWSDEMYRIFGLQPRSSHANYGTYLQRIHPDDRDNVDSLIKEAVKIRQPFKFNHKLIRPDRSIRHVHCEGRVITNRKGHAIKMFGTSQDITYERELDQAKNEFVSLASHQLRTPATGVKAFLALLADGYAGKLNKKQHQFLSNAYEANERQLHIINDLLNVASIESGKIAIKKVPTNLATLVDAVIVEHSSTIHKRKQIMNFVRPDTSIKAPVDPGRFKMIIDNLVSNAIKYTPSEGRITISLTRHAGKGFISITDTGAGIAKRDLPKLFGKFSRIDNIRSINVDGSGLGLYLARYLARLHGGDILVKSRLGRGSTFTIKVPLKANRLPQTLAKAPRKVRNILTRKAA